MNVFDMILGAAYLICQIFRWYWCRARIYDIPTALAIVIFSIILIRTMMISSLGFTVCYLLIMTVLDLKVDSDLRDNEQVPERKIIVPKLVIFIAVLIGAAIIIFLTKHQII